MWRRGHVTGKIAAPRLIEPAIVRNWHYRDSDGDVGFSMDPSRPVPRDVTVRPHSGAVATLERADAILDDII